MQTPAPAALPPAIGKLCEDLAAAVHAADWSAAAQLLRQRQDALAGCFDGAPGSAADTQQRRALAESVLAFDRQLLPHAAAAREAAAVELKKIQRGRAATELYQRHSR